MALCAKPWVAEPGILGTPPRLAPSRRRFCLIETPSMACPNVRSLSAELRVALTGEKCPVAYGERRTT